jgi:hypothetical protein
MGSLQQLISAINEVALAQNVGNYHDEVRGGYSLGKNTVESFEEFTEVIADYYNFHFTRCVSHGGSLSRTEAAGRAKKLLTQQYRRQGGDIISAYNDAHDGTNGGLRIILDIIADLLKAESVELYIMDQFERYVTPNSWEMKVDIISQLIEQLGPYLSPSIQAD